jgi:sigma-B regulation protein RsbU (phosphoserine phosphatase)
MFVTIFYAVLDLDTGVLEYANAGHNQPLLLRAGTCEIEQLSRGGMALGVLEGNTIQEGQTILQPGDHLILYTDGVTEAFSPDFEPFGEERLKETVVEAAGCPAPGGEAGTCGAGQLLNRIDQSVQAFIVDGQPSDDLTVVVLHRTRAPDAG